MNKCTNTDAKTTNAWKQKYTKIQTPTHKPAHRLQITTHKLMAAHSGLGAPQSAQRLLLGSAQILSATSLFDKASPIASRMASTHCSRSCSDSAMKLRRETNTRPSVNADMMVSITTSKWQKACVCPVCERVCPYAHEPTEYWLLLCSCFAKYTWVKDWKLYKHIHTNTHIDRFVAWRRLACLNPSSSHESNNMLVLSVSLLKIHTHTHWHTVQLLHKYTSLFRSPILSSWALALQAMQKPRDHTHHTNTYTWAHTHLPHSSSHTHIHTQEQIQRAFHILKRCPAEDSEDSWTVGVLSKTTWSNFP